MARSAAYDEWEDVGMAFTEEEVESFVPAGWVDERIEGLIHAVNVLDRRAGLPGIEKPHWSGKARDTLRNVANWYGRVRGEGIDWDSPEARQPDKKTKEGKAITAGALALDPEQWLEECEAEVIGAMRYFVTVARRASLVKSDVKLCNKIANAILNEQRAYGKCRAEFEKSPKPAKGGSTGSGGSGGSAGLAAPTAGSGAVTDVAVEKEDPGEETPSPFA